MTDPDRRFAVVAVAGTFLVAALTGFLNAVARVSQPFTVQAVGRYHLRVADSGAGAAAAWWVLPILVAVVVAAVVAAAYAAVQSRPSGVRCRLGAVTSFVLVALPAFVFALLVNAARPMVVAFDLQRTMIPVPFGALSLWGLVVPFCLLVVVPAGLAVSGSRAARHEGKPPMPWVRGPHALLAAALLTGFFAGTRLGIAVGDALVVIGGSGW